MIRRVRERSWKGLKWVWRVVKSVDDDDDEEGCWRRWRERLKMMGIKRRVMKWFTRYWYPSLMYFVFNELTLGAIAV